MTTSQSPQVGSEFFSVDSLARKFQPIEIGFQYKSVPEDFQVHEILGFGLSGEGEHLWIQIKKQHLNTHAVIAEVAEQLGLRSRDIGYSGLKDHHAITTQWLSIPIAMTQPDLLDQLINRKAIDADQAKVNQSDISHPSWSIVSQQRHSKKLRVGTHSHNQFQLHLHFEQTLSPTECDVLNARLEQIRHAGYPNYFTEQRFGRDNLQQFLHLRPRRKLNRQAGILLSAARSYWYNLQLSQRLNETQNQHGPREPVVGDVMLLSGSQSFFRVKETDSAETIADIKNRLQTRDIRYGIALPGANMSENLKQALNALIQQQCDSEPCIEKHQLLLDKTLKLADKTHYRALEALPEELNWQWSNSQSQMQTMTDKPTDQDCLMLEFTLATGSYATGLLRELGNGKDASRQ